MYNTNEIIQLFGSTPISNLESVNILRKKMLRNKILISGGIICIAIGFYIGHKIRTSNNYFKIPGYRMNNTSGS